MRLRSLTPVGQLLQQHFLSAVTDITTTQSLSQSIMYCARPCGWQLSVQHGLDRVAASGSLHITIPAFTPQLFIKLDHLMWTILQHTIMS